MEDQERSGERARRGREAVVEKRRVEGRKENGDVGGEGGTGKGGGVGDEEHLTSEAPTNRWCSNAKTGLG